jgi:hypothetical protein
MGQLFRHRQGIQIPTTRRANLYSYPVNRAGQRKATHLDELPKRFAILENLLVLNRKLQYPALAANPSTGVET